MHDKTFWQTLAENQYHLPDDAPLTELTDELLDYLRSPDPELRDDIAYATLTQWIVGGRYTPEQLRAMLRRWQADLYTGLGEQGTNSVITRSFAALMLSIIAYHDWKEPFLTDEEAHALLDTALDYFAREQDVRGYDEQLGWLHSVAHTADLLKFLARSPKSRAADLQRILWAVAEKVIAPRPTVFTHSEDERLAWVILDVLRREMLDQPALAEWLERLTSITQEDGQSDTGLRDSGYHGTYQNTKHFLRSVYFRLAYSEDLPGAHDLQEQLFEKLRLFLK